uniref:Calx-beta domain-containing protein n=1 Tax=Heterorhabditis bacteriophora TaxID=37862 RepID=A0A1I7XHY5_HETBA
MKNNLGKKAMEHLGGGRNDETCFPSKATRQIVGSGDITKKKLKKRAEELIEPLIKKAQMIIVEFDPPHYMCLENIGSLKVKVKCDRGAVDENSVVSVHYRTVADTAQEHSDFIPIEGTLTFHPGVAEQEIEIEIVDNDIYEDDEQFLVRLSQVRAHNSVHFSAVPCRLGAASTATVLIVDDDHAGAFGFRSEKFKVTESVGEFAIEVVRTRGARGEVSIPYKTVDGQAKEGQDYIHQEGVLKFVDEQTSLFPLNALTSLQILTSSFRFVDKEEEKSDHILILIQGENWLTCFLSDNFHHWIYCLHWCSSVQEVFTLNNLRNLVSSYYYNF